MPDLIKKLYNSGKYHEVLEFVDRKTSVTDEGFYAAAAASIKLGKFQAATRYILEIKKPNDKKLQKLPDLFITAFENVDKVAKQDLLYSIEGLIETNSKFIPAILRALNDDCFDEKHHDTVSAILRKINRGTAFWESYVALVSQKYLSAGLFRPILSLPTISAKRITFIKNIYSQNWSEATKTLPQLLADENDKDLVTAYFAAFSRENPTEIIKIYKALYKKSWAPILDDGEVLNVLALACRSIGDLTAARKLIDAAVSTTQNRQIMLNQATIHGDAGALKSSFDLFEALLREECSPEVLNNFGNFLIKNGFYARAEAILTKLVEQQPDSKFAKSNLAHLFTQVGNFPAVYEIYDELRQKFEFNSANFTNPLFCKNYDISVDDRELVAEYNKVADQLRIQLDLKLPAYKKVIGSKKYRIALLSPDFKNSSAAAFMEGYFALDEIEGVELYCISCASKTDSLTQQLRQRFANWIDLNTIPKSQQLEALRELQLDVVIDMAGFTGGHRVDLLINRIATKQISTLGFSYSLGGLVDGLILPSQACPTYDIGIRENIIAMETPLPFVKRAESKSKTISQDRFERQVAMCCSRAIRVNGQVLSTWSKISDKTGCEIMINSKDYRVEQEAPYLLTRHLEHFHNHAKLRVGFNTPIEEALDIADISLDCFPHSSGTTLYESILSGVPFVTLRGRQIVGYLGAYVASIAELPNYCVANTVEEYETAAIRLLSDLDYRREAKISLPKTLEKNGIKPQEYALELYEKIISLN